MAPDAGQGTAHQGRFELDITPIIPADRQVIDGYGEGQICVASEWRTGPHLVFPGFTIPWTATSFAELTLEHFQPVLEAEPKVELLLIGAGRSSQLMPKDMRAALRAAGLVVEVMDTGGACRTYNVLLSEGRSIAAALFPV